jgi:hypothetical protein
MQPDKLAPVYLDNKPVNLKDPKPRVSAILSASGKPETTAVKRLQVETNPQGRSLRSEEVVDRTTDPSKPIYLTSTAKGGPETPAWKGTGAATGFTPRIVPPFGEAPKVVRPNAGGKPGQIKPMQWGDDDTKGMNDGFESGGESADEDDE